MPRGGQSGRLQSHVLRLQGCTPDYGASLGGLDETVAGDDAEPGKSPDVHGRPTDCHVWVKS